MFPFFVNPIKKVGIKGSGVSLTRNAIISLRTAFCISHLSQPMRFTIQKLVVLVVLDQNTDDTAKLDLMARKSEEPTKR